MPADGIPLGGILADSGYAHRTAAGWAIPLRAAGAALICDLHPDDRGPKGTHAGAIIANGNLYCPATPRALLELGPLARGATPDQVTTHDQQTTALGKLRCPLRPQSMTLDRQRPEILTPPSHAPACCTQQTLTVPPAVHAKTAQKHDYPSKAHRRSYARRTAAERTFSTAKDPASNDISRGWCRLMGLTAPTLFTATLLTIRNQRILDAWTTRQARGAQRTAAGLPPRTRRRRRTPLASLAAAPP
jgi:hypothetical protein